MATPLGGSAARNHHRTATRIVATVTALALGGALALAAPLVASADEHLESYAKGQFLSGDLLGIDLDAIVSLGSAEATNDGTQPTQTEKDPLDVAVLEDAVVIQDSESPQIDLGGVQIGAAAQFALANNDGTSLGASGAITDDGAIGFGDHQNTPPANATIDLQALLGNEFASTLADLELELGAISAHAQANLDTASGDYQIADAVLTFSSPAIANLTPKVDAALAEVVDALGELIGGNGALIDDVNGLLVDLDPVLNLLGGSANVSATINAGNLEEIVHAILEEEYGNGAVSFDLETGEVHVDLEVLLGGDLNDLAPGTELLTDAVVNQILEGITTTVATIADQVVDKVEDALHDATVDIHADLSTNIAQSPIVREVCELVDSVLTTPVLVDVSAVERLLNGLTGDLGVLLNAGIIGSLTDALPDDVGDYVLDGNGVLKRITGFVNQTTQETVCNTTSTPVAPLTTSVVLDIEATVDELIDGAAARAVAQVKVLGIGADLDLSLLIDGLGDSLVDGLFDGDGAVQDLVDALEAGLVHPATEGLLGSGVGSVGDALRDVISIKANVQELGGGQFTETAVRVSALGQDLATLNLAQAIVGPNVTTIVDPECTDPDGCDTGGETVTPPGGGGPGGDGGGGGAGSLAYTGIGIATLIAVILALLAAGAYLVREGYRRNHPVVTTIA